MIRRKVVLLILDGWGIAADKSASALDDAQTPFIDSLYKRYPHSKLKTSGLAVGLPDGQMGNSEVGHITLGAGRVVDQDLTRISKALKTSEFLQNQTIADALVYAETNQKNIHLMGLLSDGGVHSHIDHLRALTSLIGARSQQPVFVHAFLDGRDTDPHSGLEFLRELDMHLANTGGCLATVMGRYFAMDRDKRWERTSKAYRALVQGEGQLVNNLIAAVEQAYADGLSDEFMPPLVAADSIGHPVGTIAPGDVVFCFNFRTDRCRQITTALTQRAFPDHNMIPLPLYYLTMTRYDDTFTNVNVVFEKEIPTHTLGEVIANEGLKQLRIAETEKYPHVTFFFSGGREKPFDGESRILRPSPKVATYDLEPAMSAFDIRDAVVGELDKKSADFICLNFANADMVGHTGVWSAVVEACQTVDKCVRDVVTAAHRNNYTVLLLADHGNADKMTNADGSPNTAHTLNPVPCIVIDELYHGKLHDGELADVAPTVLAMMGLPIPEVMTGTPLVDWPGMKHKRP